MKVGIAGASGYTGIELLRLLAAHPEFEVAVASADTSAGDSVGRRTPAMAATYPQLTLAPTEPGVFDGLDVVFCALPHGQSQHLVPQLRSQVGTIVDLAADFRLHDAAAYPQWYGEAHTAPELLGEAVYGLPERHRDELSSARLVAAPGCYPTAATLALAPFTTAGLVENDGIVVDAASGTSGAGRAPRDHLHFGHVDGDFTAYGLLTHRHTPEMEQELGARVLFTPHLAPMVRGILATCYARPSGAGAAPLDTDGAMAVLHQVYDAEPFVVVTGDPPSTKATFGANCAHVTARVDPRTGWLVVLCAIDNLVKGASGQAVQCANLAVGFAEETGLPTAGVYP